MSDTPKEQTPRGFLRWLRPRGIGQKIIFGLVVFPTLILISQCRLGEEYYFEMFGWKGNSILDMAKVRIVFEGVPFSGQDSGRIIMDGLHWGGYEVNGGTQNFDQKSVGGVTTIQFAGYTVKFTDDANKLVYGTNTFPLSGEKKTILLHRDGSAEVSQ